jgi:tetratricopeptide (TPR) repeat protein
MWQAMEPWGARTASLLAAATIKCKAESTLGEQLAMNQSEDNKICPYCFESIKRQAVRCKHCHADLAGNPSVQAKDQATIGGAYGVTIGGQGFRIEGGIHYTLSELDTLDEETKTELRQKYEKMVHDFPELAQYHFALGLSYLDQRLYGLSVTYLRRAIGKTISESNLLYYIALAQIGGKRPRGLNLTTIKEIEGFLEAAIRLAPNRPHYKLLLAIVKYDYYFCNGLRVPPPDAAQLLHDAQSDDPDPEEVRLLCSHLSLPEGPLLSAIHQF